jgi:poly-gamma-glutamate synthesis protein (capsule biosynthesis protein)
MEGAMLDRRGAILTSLLLCYASASFAQPTPAAPFRMALTGDAIITRKLSVYKEPEFVRMIELIRGADVAFTNVEMLFHDYEPWPMHESGGTYMRAEPELIKELVWAGFDLGSMANNHTGDYSPEAMRLTMKYAREAGLVTAGTGENLYEAREARFVETANGRTALISVASTFTAHSVASKPRGAVRGRPGLSPLRWTSRRIITAEQMTALRAGLQAAGIGGGRRGGGAALDRVTVGENVYEVGETAGTRSEPNPEDVREIADVVRNAAKLADYVIVTIHSHEAGPNNSPAEFLVTFARAMIDAGADAFVGHGPHFLKGIEVYKGKPIFYSLGDFVFQNETLLRLPFENYAPYRLGDTAHVADFNAARYSNDTRGFPANREIWESVVAVPAFRGKQLVSIELHPITLGFGQSPAQRGRPKFADAQLGQKIINDLIERSKPFNTTIEWKNGIGHVVLR